MANLFGIEETKEPEIIRALWFNQPFASLMLPPFNKDETRGRRTKVKGKVLICACKRPYDLELVNEICGNNQYLRIIKTQIINWNAENDVFGKAIAIGNLTDCKPMRPEDEDKCFVSYRSGLWRWIFRDVQPIEPFEIKGKQGWGIIDEETKNKIHILKQS